MPEDQRETRFDLVLFGGTGDLALRKLMPALYYGMRDGGLRGANIVGAARQRLSADEYRALLTREVPQHLAQEDYDPATWDRLMAQVRYVSIDASRPEDFGAIRAELVGGEETPRVFYLATTPSLFVPICRHLAGAGLVSEGARVVLEKPLGRDLASSQTINDAVGAIFPEERIYRIDHYLGKEMVQNLMALRFGNMLLEPLWSRAYVHDVQITIAETVGVGTRGEFYEHTGALRDMVQNHLLQLLCLVAMEPPTYVGRETVRDEKLKVLQALKPMAPADVDCDTVRGRYGAGLVDGEAVPSYADDLGHSSDTETFVALRAEVQNWRWAGVPVYLRTGKRMDRRASEIVVVFKEPPHAMFPHSEGVTSANRLHIQVQPDEGMRLHLTAKEPGPGGIRLRPVSLDLSYATTFDQPSPDAYERLLMDVIKGNPTLFMRRDEVEAAWQWIEPILTRWAVSPDRPKRYPAGTPGPTAAAMLLERDGRTWQEHDQ